MRGKGLFLVPFVVALALTLWGVYMWRQSEEVFNYDVIEIVLTMALPFMFFYLIMFMISLFVVSIRK